MTAIPVFIDAYLQQVPEPQRKTLEKIRRVIRAAAPGATKIISYQMPYISRLTKPLPSSLIKK